MNQGSLFPDHQFWDPEVLEEFMLSGNSKITVRSEKTMKHFTYKIRKDKDNPLWYVNKLSSSNSYIYVGTIFDDYEFRPTRRTQGYVLSMDWYKAFVWLWQKLHFDRVMPPNTTVFHEGRCGMCGLELTDPVSIKEGYGPDCRKKRLRRDFMRDNKIS